MSKLQNPLLLLLKNGSPLSLTTRNVNQFINRIPYPEEALTPSSPMEKYVEKEMKAYPIIHQAPSYLKQNKGEQSRKTNKTKGAQLMKYVFEFTTSSNYLVIEEARQLLQTLNTKDLIENQEHIQMLRKSVNDCLNRNDLSEHASQQIQLLLRQIRELQNKLPSKTI